MNKIETTEHVLTFVSPPRLQVARHCPVCPLDVRLRLRSPRALAAAAQVLPRRGAGRRAPPPAARSRPRAPEPRAAAPPRHRLGRPPRQPGPRAAGGGLHGAGQHAAGGGGRHHVPQGRGALPRRPRPSPRPPLASFRQ